MRSAILLGLIRWVCFQLPSLTSSKRTRKMPQLPSQQSAKRSQRSQHEQQRATSTPPGEGEPSVGENKTLARAAHLSNHTRQQNRKSDKVYLGKLERILRVRKGRETGNRQQPGRKQNTPVGTGQKELLILRKSCSSSERSNDVLFYGNLQSK
jgi:hypothetical protein